jgi:hypothetical protein
MRYGLYKNLSKANARILIICPMSTKMSRKTFFVPKYFPRFVENLCDMSKEDKPWEALYHISSTIASPPSHSHNLKLEPMGLGSHHRTECHLPPPTAAA